MVIVSHSQEVIVDVIKRRVVTEVIARFFAVSSTRARNRANLVGIPSRYVSYVLW